LNNPLKQATFEKIQDLRHRKGKAWVTGWHKATILIKERGAVEVAELDGPPIFHGGLF